MIVILLTSMEKLLINISGRYVLPDIAGQLLHFALTNIQLLYWFEQGACATGATKSPFLKALFLSLSILFVAKVLPMYSIKVPQIHPRPPPHTIRVLVFSQVIPGFWTLDVISEALWEMFEGDFADMCTVNFCLCQWREEHTCAKCVHCIWVLHCLHQNWNS